MKFEIVVLPVSDVDRAKEFYERHWMASIIFGKNVVAARPAPHKACI
jgi:catechol 2,3-dioxygenase-like lactoylglutathione lyase family enzyme